MFNANIDIKIYHQVNCEYFIIEIILFFRQKIYQTKMNKSKNIK